MTFDELADYFGAQASARQTQLPAARWLHATCHGLHRVVEVGAWMGWSACVMASAGPLVLSVDTFDGAGMSHPEDTWGRFREHVLACGYADRVLPIIGPSAIAAGVLRPAWADLVFIDGTHETPAVRQDIALWRPVVRPGGLLCGDDWNLASVCEAVTTLLPHAQVAGEGYLWWVRV